jgi:glycosyltransferase involved in cell wall biosynthesis
VRILKLHNLQFARGGADAHHERETIELTRRGHTVETQYVDNHQIELIGRPRAAVRCIWNREATQLVRAVHKRFQPDLVHVHEAYPLMSPAVMIQANRLGLGVVATSHAWRYNCANSILFRDGAVCEDCVGRRVKYPAVLHRCYHDSVIGSAAMAGSLAVHRRLGTFSRYVHRWLALTPFMRERLMAEGIPADHIVVKPSAAPDPGPPLSDRDDYLLFAGRLIPEKGVDTLLQAWQRTTTAARLVIAGDGPLMPLVSEAAARDSRIDVRGWVDHVTVAALLARAIALLLPSEWYEGLPSLMSESYAAGTPIIGSDVGNFSDYIAPDRTGMLFRNGDPASLAQAIDSYVVNPARVRRFQAGAREMYDRQLNLDHAIDILESVYADAVRLRRGGN